MYSRPALLYLVPVPADISSDIRQNPIPVRFQTMPSVHP